MIEKQLQQLWGTEYIISPEEFFSFDNDYWRNKIYERSLLIFKEMKFSKPQYVNFCKRFGRLWKKEDYLYSYEATEAVEVDDHEYYISPFSNVLSRRLGNHTMPWHADIPNRDIDPYPMRSLWITKNPFPQISGKTIWLNLDHCFEYLTKEQKELLDRVIIVQQSWYNPGTEIKEFPFIKTHPVTGKKSLRLNHYNDQNQEREDAWIIGVKIDGVLQPDCSLIKNFLEHLEKEQALTYEHTWSTFDIAIYDNWSFVHGRSRVITGPKGERHFYRVNIDHIPDNT
jgi:alpha-ketoglutarate-dependent taurine dioxygenase